MADKVDVSTPSLAYTEMHDTYWETTEPLRGGTQAMRDVGARLLPLAEKEEAAQWRYRRDRSFLFPAYDDAINRLVAKPFRRAVVLNGDVPEELADLELNADLEGRSLTNLAEDVFDAGVNYGLTHVFCDFQSGGEDLTPSQQRALGLRPYFTHVTPPNLLAWRSANLASGEDYLTHARIRTLSVEIDPENEWAEIEVERIKVYDAPVLADAGDDDYIRFLNNEMTAKEFEDRGGQLTSVRVFEKNDKGDWFENVAKRTVIAYPGIPLLTYYTARTGYMTAMPLMWSLADLNVHHWQIGSDYGNIIHVAMVPILKALGFDDKQIKQISFGPNRAFQTDRAATDAVLEWLELQSGTGIKAGREELDRIEARMRHLSMEPEINKVGQPTATGRAIDEAKATSVAQARIIDLQSMLEDAYRCAATWIGRQLQDEFAVDVFSDFVLGMKGPEDIETIDKDRDRKDITAATLLREKQRRGVYDEKLDVDEEVRLAHLERDALSFDAPEPDDEDQEDEEDEDDGVAQQPVEVE